MAEAKRSARRQKVSVKAEVLLYAVHGMLHLCGYDDRNERAFVVMHRTEDSILSELGIGPVFLSAGRRVR